MTDKTSANQGKTGLNKKNERQAKLAVRLRENLKRRKTPEKIKPCKKTK